MKTKVQYATGDELEACKWGGFMGHTVLLVRDNCSATRNKPGARVMANDVKSALREGQHGDRVYQLVAPKKWKLVHTVNIMPVNAAMREASNGML